MPTEDIRITLTSDLSNKAGQYQSLINSSPMSQENKNKLSANLSEMQNLLGKGAKISVGDLNRISSLIKSITDALVKANAGTENFSKEILALQSKLEDAVKRRDAARQEANRIARTKITQDDKGGWDIRKSEIERQLKEHPVLNQKGTGNYQSADAVLKAAQAGYQPAVEFVNYLRNTVVPQMQQEYTDAIQKAAQADEEVKQTTGDLSKMATDPTKSKAVEIQTLGNEIQNFIDKIRAAVKGENTGGTGGLPGGEGASIPLDTLNKVNTAGKQQNSTFKQAFKTFSVYAIVLRAVKRAAHEAVQTIKQLDKSLTEQAMVTGKTRKQTYELLKSYQALAAQVGATTKEIAEVATQFMRQGKSTQDALKLTEAAVSAAKVASISASESVDYLTTALNGFRLSAEDAMRVSDKFAAVAATSATSYEEIATALSKVAAQANLAGMSIDYTTALLAKGIETTREAPETIGTALKTVIARMRELTDYGSTLEGDTDVNNVEAQLAYVGIALRDINGELRSSEDVLNELGPKWETLNTNQQAAIAKSMAGTRQQARFIAMMTDYERVLELQEISERSAGATMSQMATYMQGMEAALNKVNIAWEKIVTAITDSDVIIGLVNAFSKILDIIGKILNFTPGMIAAIVISAVTGLKILGQKRREYKIQKDLQQVQAIRNVTELKALKIQLKKEESQLRSKESLTAEEQLRLQEIENETRAIDYQIEQNEAMISATGKISNGLNDIASGLGTIIGYSSMLLISLFKIIIAKKASNKATKESIAATKKENVETEKGFFAKLRNAGAKMAESAASIPVAGWVIAAAILAAVGIAIGVSAAQYASSGQKAADQTKELAASIYKLNQETNAISSITSQFDKLDNKLIKTNKDLEEMNSLLDSAADKLSDDEIKGDIGFGKGISAKQYYEQFTTTEGRRAALDKITEVNRAQIRQKYLKELDILASRTDWLTGNRAQDLTRQEALRTTNNAFMYERIDTLKQEQNLSNTTASAIEHLTQSLLENMDIQDAWALGQDKSGKKVQDFTDRIAGLYMHIGEANITIAEILGSQDYSLKEQVQALQTAEKALGATSVEYQALAKTYREIADFSDFNEATLDFLERSNITIDELNNFYESLTTLQKSGWQITKEEWEGNFEGMLNILQETNGDIEAVINTYYSEQKAILKELSKTDEEFAKSYSALINAFANTVEVGVLNMGQNLDKLSSSINIFYEKASNWATMKETDKTQFISDNAEYFAGPDGAALLEAFETGNYNQIEKALKSNAALQKTVSQRLADIEQDLMIEEARIGSDRNEAYIQYLKEWRDKLADQTKIFRADLETLIDQEQKQLDVYKDYLQKRHDALEKSLNDRKSAYEKYFEAINQEEEMLEYEEKANTLMTNLNKIATSTDADSNAKRKELETQLKELEKEQQKTLRENAQQALLESMEDEVSQINDKFDKLLENNQQLLELMTSEMNADPGQFLQNIMASALANGAMTNLQAENFVQELRSTFAGSMAGIDWDNVGARTENNQLILNVNGREIILDSSSEQSLYEEIYAALVRAGYGK